VNQFFEIFQKIKTAETSLEHVVYIDGNEGNLNSQLKSYSLTGLMKSDTTKGGNLMTIDPDDCAIIMSTSVSEYVVVRIVHFKCFKIISIKGNNRKAKRSISFAF